MRGRCLETVILVELASTIVECMYKHGSYPCVLRDQYTALQRIMKHRCTQFHPLSSCINCQTGQDHHWNRIRHVLASGPCCILVRNSSSGQSVIAHDLLLTGRDDERSAGTTDLVAQSATLEPLIELRFTAGERIDLVIWRQRLGSVQIHATAFQGALTASKRSSPGLGCTGASIMALNSRNLASSRLKNT